MALRTPPATGAPIITGTARVGETLRASTAEISDDDGKPSVFTYQWVRVTGSSRTDIGADQSTYKLRTADAGSTIEVEVTFTDVAGNSEGPLTSAATDVVASNNAPLAPEKPRVYGSSMQSGSTTVLEVQWQVPRHWTDNPPSIDSYDVRYRVLESESWSPGPQDVTVTRATITGLTAGTHYEVQVRSTTANGDSVWSKAAKGRTRTAGRPHDGDVRLTGGSTDREGRLEVRHNSKWGTVCDDRLEDTGNVALQLACQMMGYTGGELIPRGSVSPAPESQKTWLDDLRCFEGSTHWTGSPATRLDQCNHAGWGLENCSHEEDAHLRCLGSGTQEIEDPPLTARFEDVPTTHDGETPFSFHLALSEPIRNGYAAVRDHAFEVIGGTVTRARRVDRQSDRWEIRITPEGDTEVAITLAADRACGTRGALCTGNGRALSTPLAIQIPGPGTTTTPPPGVTPLTARFANVPSEHDGGTAFTVEVIFSEAPAGMNNRALRAALEVTRGTTRRVRKVNSDRAHRIVTVRPDGWDSVDIVLPPSPECEATGAICTNAGARLEAGLATRIQGPPGLTVADAEVQEGMNAVLAFAVTLDRAPYSQASVDYATSDGTATAGEDYSATSGTLTFAPGEREKTVSVPVLDDAHDEGSETMTLTLSSASGAHVIDGTAIGTINNTDPMPLAWMVRFGRTVGSHVVDALGQRLEGGTASHVTVGGIPLTGTPGTLPEAQSDDPFALPAWASGTQRAKSAQELSGNDLLLGSTFHLSSGAGESAGTAYTAWGRVATSGFETTVDDVTMDGDVTSGLVGFDAEWDRVLAGIMLSHSAGDGEYRLSAKDGGGTGSVESSLTGVYPYARLALNPRMSAWALAGAGTGELTLTPDGKKPMPTDIAMRMGAVGFKGRVLGEPGEDTLVLNIKSDAMWVGTKNEKTPDMVATEGDVTRLRVTLEGERAFAIGEGATFTPSAEVGLRQDGGDAETGTGLEVGAGLRYAAGPLTVEGKVRTLIAHEETGYEEWGMSGAIHIAPSSSGRGLMLRIAPEWGRTASAAERIWSARDASALTPGGEFEEDARLAVDAGYGVGLAHRRGVLTPYAGLTLGDAGSRTIRTGARWRVGPDLVLGLEGTRQTSDAREGDNELMLRIALRF